IQRKVPGEVRLPRTIGIHYVDLAAVVASAAGRERDAAAVARPIGTRVVERLVGELRDLGTICLHDECLEQVRSTRAGKGDERTGDRGGRIVDASLGHGTGWGRGVARGDDSEER